MLPYIFSFNFNILSLIALIIKLSSSSFNAIRIENCIYC